MPEVAHAGEDHRLAGLVGGGEVTVDGAPVAYDVAGSGPPVLLVHAGVADRRMWDPLVPLLSARAFRARVSTRSR